MVQLKVLCMLRATGNVFTPSEVLLGFMISSLYSPVWWNWKILKVLTLLWLFQGQIKGKAASGKVESFQGDRHYARAKNEVQGLFRVQFCLLLAWPQATESVCFVCCCKLNKSALWANRFDVSLWRLVHDTYDNKLVLKKAVK